MPTRVDRAIDPATMITEELLRYLYVDRGKSLASIGEQVGLSADQVAQLVERWELARPRVHQRYGLTKELLEGAYIQERKSVGTIAKELDVPQQAVSAALKFHGIEFRTRTEAVSRGLDQILSHDFLKERLDAGNNVGEIAAEAGTTETTVNRYLALAGLRPAQEPNPAYDAMIDEGRIRSDYLGTGIDPPRILQLLRRADPGYQTADATTRNRASCTARHRS